MARRPSARDLTVWRAFLQAHAAVVRVLERELLTETGMPLAWYDVLIQLRQAPAARLRMSALAEAALLSRSGLTRLVDRLEREGLVRRERCATDARGWFVVLTEAGGDRLKRAAPVHLRGIATHFTDRLTPEQAETLRAALSAVARAALDDSRAAR
ncbi:MAG: MarR family winged helix-turn-helix transcriptional regulator [Egibacteraceae bacterium]